MSRHDPPRSAVEPLPDGLAQALERADAYPHDASAARGVEHVQTHISHVFLTGERVYKLRKAVALPFVSFATRAERDADCVREVELNRRLAPEVYLGIAAVEPVPGPDAGFRVGPIDALGATAAPARGAVPPLAAAGVEHAVVMRRLAPGTDAPSLLAAGRFDAQHVDATAACVARFHAGHGLGRPAPFLPESWQRAATTPFLETLALARSARRLASEPAGPQLTARVEAAARAAMARLAPRFETRREAGRAVDGHGDLHLQHLWFDPAFAADGELRPLLIDCIEFRDDWRRIDAAAEVAFLSMDLRYRGRADLGERFLRRYARDRDDFDLYAVVDYYAAYRAAVRGAVAAVAADDAAIEPAQRERALHSAQRHLELSLALLGAPGRGALLLVSGTVGSGKSTVAEAVADVVHGVVIGSDRTRKHLAGLPPDARGDARLYDDAAKRRVYEALRERAAAVVASGRVAILDATFARAHERSRSAAWAQAHGVDAWLVEVGCDPAVARERLAARARSGGDPSDAGPERLAASLAEWEPPAEWLPERHLRVRTDAPGWPAALRRQLARAGLARAPDGTPEG